MNNSNSAHKSESGKLLEYVQASTGEPVEYSVIWMHGLGADGHDFEPIIPYLGLARSFRVRFIFPHALMRPVTVNGGAVMRAWYDIIDLGTSRGQDEAGIKHSAAKITALIEHEIERGIPASKIVLAGFSQGGAMALYAGLRYPQKLAGIMVLSAYLLFPERLQDELAHANSETPVFVAHGRQDPVVPFSLGEAVRSVLTAGRWPVEWHSYPLPHSVSTEEIADIGRWLQGRFN